MGKILDNELVVCSTAESLNPTLLFESIQKNVLYSGITKGATSLSTGMIYNLSSEFSTTTATDSANIGA